MSYIIENISAQDLQRFDNIDQTDRELITEFEINSVFNSNTNFVEINFFSEDNNLLLSDSSYKGFSILSGAITSNREESSKLTIDPEKDIQTYLLEGNNVKILYNFLNNIYTDFNSTDDFIIESISSDRTEIRLQPFGIDQQVAIEKTQQFLQKLNSQSFVQDFSLYQQNNTFYTATNIKIQEVENISLVVIKLYNPLPTSVEVKSRVSLVEQVNESVAFQSRFKIQQQQQQQSKLRGPNFSIDVEQESNEQSQFLNFDELFSIDSNNSTKQLNSLISERSAEISIDYSNLLDFINFSSAEERLNNFKYKVQLIERYENNINLLNNGQGDELVKSINYYEKLVKGIVDNFDHFERHLYYDNTNTSWPKTDNSIPYTLASSDSQIATDWFNSNITTAQTFDNTNYNALINTIPTYLKESPDNDPYTTFINMIGHHFDNLWIYTKAVTDKYNADNRLDKGVSKDLIEEVLTSFGVKIYSSSKSIEDLFRYFTQDSYDPEGEIINTATQVGEQVSQKDYQKQIYKRIYHNLPLLLKSKGTERGVKALINCFGIPSDILQIRYYGGQSSKQTPFYGGEQSYTSSLDKIRLSNTGSIVEGETLSQYTSIYNKDKSYTQDIHKVDLGFSPSNDVNKLIESALVEDFNIDNFIGDPRKGTTRSYSNLEKLSRSIFTQVDKYNTKDFVRLIKFFDNTIFKMIKDFLPARTVTNTGIIIKPHLLDRSKGVEPIMTFTQEMLTGSIDTAFITGSHGNSFNSGSEEYSTNYIQTVQTPTGKVEKKWEGSNGHTQYQRSAEESKYDGEFSGSVIEVVTGELNQENPFKQIKYQDLKYDLRFLSRTPQGICLLEPTEQYTQTIQYFESNNNNTINGDLKPIMVNQLFRESSGPIEYTSSFDQTSEQVSRSNIEDPYSLNLNTFIPQPTNYVDLNIKANNIDINTDQEGIPGECITSVNFEVVFCNLEANSTSDIVTLYNKVLPKLNKYDSFNLSSFFSKNRNTDSKYSIEGYDIVHNIDDIHLGQLEFLDNITLPTNDTSHINLELTDNIDTNCSDQLNIDYTTCPLYSGTQNNLVTIRYTFNDDAIDTVAYNPSYIFDIPDSVDTTHIYNRGGTIYLSNPHDTRSDAFNDDELGSAKSYTGKFGIGSEITAPVRDSVDFFKILYATGNAQRFIGYVASIDDNPQVRNLYRSTSFQDDLEIGNIIIDYEFRIFAEYQGQRRYLLTENSNYDKWFSIISTTKKSALEYSDNKNLSITTNNTPYKPEYVFPENYNDFYKLKLPGNNLLEEPSKIFAKFLVSPQDTPSPNELINRADHFASQGSFKIQFRAILDSECVLESQPLELYVDADAVEELPNDIINVSPNSFTTDFLPGDITTAISIDPSSSTWNDSVPIDNSTGEVANWVNVTRSGDNLTILVIKNNSSTPRSAYIEIQSSGTSGVREGSIRDFTITQYGGETNTF